MSIHARPRRAAPDEVEVSWRGDDWRKPPAADAEPSPAAAPVDDINGILRLLTFRPQTAFEIAEQLDMRSQAVGVALAPLVAKGLAARVVLRPKSHRRKRELVAYTRVRPPAPLAPVPQQVRLPVPLPVSVDPARGGALVERPRHTFRRAHQPALHDVRPHADGRAAQPLRAVPARELALR